MNEEQRLLMMIYIWLSGVNHPDREKVQKDIYDCLINKLSFTP